ncbi:MAG: hypothetical protein KIS91_13760, partial [Anaerolineae bacterium]|nr:hypothetical protein [Anaerolineae bacterium]
WDYSKTDLLLQAGYNQAVAFLGAMQPAPVPWHARARQRAAALLRTPRPAASDTKLSERMR